MKKLMWKREGFLDSLTVCSYPKVAILPLNFKRETAFQIYDKLSYEGRTRHFWVGAVSSCALFPFYH